MLILALLAIIVVGPRDLPKLMRTVAKVMGQIRAMGQEFRDAFDEMAATEEMSELQKEIDELKKLGKLSNLSDEAMAEDLRKINTELRDATEGTNPKAPEPKKSEDKD